MNLKLLAAVAAATLSLAACEPRAEQDARIAATLPKGCELTDLGKYRDIDQLVVIRCPFTNSTTVGIKRDRILQPSRAQAYAVVSDGN